MMSKFKDMTIGEFLEFKELFEGAKSTPQTLSVQSNSLDDDFSGYVIIRTYSAGVWFGQIIKKAGEEVILNNARRLYYWKTVNKGISLSEVALHGLHNDSKVCEATQKQWLKAIEITPCTQKAIDSIKEKANYVA